MRVTRVSIDSYTPDASLKASCTVVLDDVICIHHLHVISGKGGLFVSYPNTGLMKLYKRGKRYTNIIHPCNEELRKHIEDEVLKEYIKQK